MERWLGSLEPQLLHGPVLVAPSLPWARSPSCTLCSLVTGLALPPSPGRLQLPPSAQGSERITVVVGGKTQVPSSPGCRHGESQGWVGQGNASAPLAGGSFRVSWPSPCPWPLHSGAHHSAYPCTEVAVLGVAYLLWAGAKEVCKKGRVTPQPLHFHFAPGYKLSRQPRKISGSGSSAPIALPQPLLKEIHPLLPGGSFWEGCLKVRSSLPLWGAHSARGNTVKFVMSIGRSAGCSSVPCLNPTISPFFLLPA